MRGQRKYLFWIIVGIVVFWAELLLLCLSSNYELLKETVVLFAVPAALFWVINRYRKETPFHFIKSVVCIWIGKGVFDVMAFHISGREAMWFLIFWQIMLTILLLCMKITQMVYDRVPDKGVYLGYVLTGITLAFNVAYVVREYTSYPRSSGGWMGAALRDIYVLEHGIALLIAIAVVGYQYQNRYKIRIKNGEITGRTYRYNAVKMTIVSFLVFVGPLYQLFLSE